MTYMWSLTHLMQLLRIIILVNVPVPWLLAALCRYFVIATGEVEIIVKYLPAVITDYILNPLDFIQTNVFFQDKFTNDYGVESPYLLVEFEKGFFYSTILNLVAVVSLMALKLIFKK